MACLLQQGLTPIHHIKIQPKLHVIEAQEKHENSPKKGCRYLDNCLYIPRDYFCPYCSAVQWSAAQ